MTPIPVELGSLCGVVPDPEGITAVSQGLGFTSRYCLGASGWDLLMTTVGFNKVETGGVAEWTSLGWLCTQYFGSAFLRTADMVGGRGSWATMLQLRRWV